MWIWNKHDKAGQKVKNYLSMEKFPVIEGYNFDGKFNFGKFVDSYRNMGFQGSNFGIAVSIMGEMLEKKKKGLKIFLSFTGNMVSSGNREIITYLCRHKVIDGITTTAASLEEDVIKCIKPFHLGSFDVRGKILLDECVGRIGNIFVPSDRYTYFERFMNEIFAEIHSNGILCTHDVAREMGLHLKKHEATRKNAESSFLCWCAENSIPVFCPGITDGAIGDIATFFRQKNPSFAIDMVKDNEILTKMMMNSEVAGSIILGGGIAKHFLLNSAIFRDGFDYSIYITTATEFDGSDSGGNQEEAITWAKIKPDAKRVKVVADATLLFPLLVAAVHEKIGTGK